MNKKRHSKLWLYFSGVVFITGFIVFTITALIWLLLFELDIIQIDPHTKKVPIVLFLFGSMLLGTTIALFVGKRIIRPIQNICNAFDELSRGNFEVKVPENEPIEEIREMAQHFNSMTYDLSHIETLRTDFVANVSHEFKTPIASIEGYAALLQDSRLTPEKHSRYVEKILDNSRRLSSLCSSILMLSKLENQEMILDKKEYRIDEQIRKSILMLESKWSAKNIEFELDLPKQLYFGSEQLIGQIWSNIIDNAIKHSPENGVIEINMHTENDMLKISITDHGGGMTEEVQKHIFEKFYQADTSRSSEGSGLGLALVKRILDLCGGTVAVKSTQGAGATFVIFLPL
ncbi:MAG: ATP-binding protein [Huintestinicola sp.]|uniref:HAMP domain-containing sensor histidine kinase n=1 Tax=Huintestinicola sp. TaxID=2981661 RepID=UPI003F128BA1